jgi:polyphosphate kinase
MGSADWMKRNLSYRIEVLFPVINPQLKKEVMAILQLQLEDNTKAMKINADMKNIPIKNKKKKVRAQIDAYELIRTGELT